VGETAHALEGSSPSNIGVLHLAGEVSQMQSKVTSAASKLLQSADMVRKQVYCSHILVNEVSIYINIRCQVC